MIESTKFKKMLHILKTDSKDLNIEISIIDYDAYKECDYEVLILHLKEVNTQNGATVYKDFIIRSQLYYNEFDDKYYSALDGDAVAVGMKPTKIDVLTEITEPLFEQDSISIQVKLLDAETQEALKNQSIFMYLSSSLQESFLSATTDENGIVIFTFSLSDMNILKQDCILHFEYLGNKTYRKSKSDYFVVDFNKMKTQDITSSIDAYLEPNDILNVTYNISCDSKNLSDGFKKYTTLDIDEEKLIDGTVSFYASKSQRTPLYIGKGVLKNTSDTSYCSITANLPNEYYNEDIKIQGIFSGNDYYEQNVATTFIRADKISPIATELEVYKTPDGFKTRLRFWVESSAIEDGLYRIGFDTLYRLFGKTDFYLKNADGIWGTFIKHNPFHTTTSFEITHQDNLYEISTITEDTNIDIANYGLQEGDELYVKAVYSENALINDFEIEGIADEEVIVKEEVTFENIVVKVVDAEGNLIPAQIEMANTATYVSDNGIFNFTYDGLLMESGVTDTYLFSNTLTFVIVSTEIGIKRFNFEPSVENEEIILRFPEVIQDVSLTFYESLDSSYAEFSQTSIQNPTPLANYDIELVGVTTSTDSNGVALLPIADGVGYRLVHGDFFTGREFDISVKNGVAYIQEDDEEYPFILLFKKGHGGGIFNPDIPLN